MFGITPMRRPVNLIEQSQTMFGGREHRAAAGDGSIYDDRNVCADRYPALTVRPRREQRALVAKPNGLHIRDCVAWVDGKNLVIDGVSVAEVADSKKVLAGIQDKLVIWPDKVLYDRGTGELKRLEAAWEGDADFSDGTYAGEPALANTVTVKADLSGIFRAGDGVTVQIYEGGYLGEVLGAHVIQELEYDPDTGKTELRFHEETWRRFVAEAEGGESSGEFVPLPGVGLRIYVIIRRSVPDLDIVFEHHNRLWGAKGGTIYASSLGDPTNWQVFDGLTTDSYELQTGSPGEITGGCSYGGRPMFFKEREIIKVYGDWPGQYSTESWESLGVERGSGGSLAVAGDTLFYKSQAGIMAYTGAYPWSVAEAFGEVKYRNAAAGSDGVKYYVSMEDCDGTAYLYTYDTRYRLWHREDGARMVGFGYDGELYAMEERGVVLILGTPREQTSGEEGISSMVEFADFTDGTTRKKGLERLVLRLEVDAGTKLDIKVQYDSDGVWHTVRRVEGGMAKGQIEVPLTIRRCDHYRLRLEGTGLGGSGWTLYALTRTRYTGSNRK